MKKRISQNNNLPKFNLIVANTIKKELIEVLECNRVSIKDLLTLNKVTWDNFVIPLALLEDSLNKMWSPIRHLNSVKSSTPLREAYSECLPLLSEYTSEISQNKALYDKFLIIFKSKEFDKLNSPQKKPLVMLSEILS